MRPDPEKHRRLAALQARFGGAVQRPEVTALSTGYPRLDGALGIGGVPRGHLTLIHGQPTSGASTLALNILAGATHNGEQTVYLDLARTFDADYAVRCGVLPEHLVLIQPESFAAAVDALTFLVKAVGAAVLDASQTLGEAPNASAVRRLMAGLQASACVLVIVGGSRLDNDAAVRLETTRERWLRRRRDVRGYRIRVRITRNRFAPPDRVVRLTIGGLE